MQMPLVAPEVLLQMVPRFLNPFKCRMERGCGGRNVALSPCKKKTKPKNTTSANFWFNLGKEGNKENKERRKSLV